MATSHCTRLLICFCVLTAATTAYANPPKVSIYVGPQTRDGFIDVDKGVIDTIKDIKNELLDKKQFQVVAKKEEATLILEVLSRGATSSYGGGAATMPIGTTMFTIPIGTIGLATMLHVGEYEKPFVFENCGTWRHCARLIADDIETWVDANRAALK